MLETREIRKKRKSSKPKKRDLVNQETRFTKIWKSGYDDMVASFEDEKIRNIFWLCRGSSFDFSHLIKRLRSADQSQQSCGEVGLRF